MGVARRRREVHRFAAVRVASWTVISVAFAAAFLLVGLSANSGLHNWVAKMRIPFDHASAVGTVSDVNANNHGTCAFTFVVSGRRYSGSDHACGDRKPGDRLSVNYYPPRPQTLSSSSAPATLCAEAIGVPAIGATIFALGIWATLRKRCRVQMDDQPSRPNTTQHLPRGTRRPST